MAGESGTLRAGVRGVAILASERGVRGVADKEPLDICAGINVVSKSRVEWGKSDHKFLDLHFHNAAASVCSVH